MKRQDSFEAATDEGRQTEWRWLFAAYVAVTLAVSLVAAYIVVRHSPARSIFELYFCVGETAHHLLTYMGISCFQYEWPKPGDLILLRSARMPVATWYAAAAAVMLGPSHVLAAALLKTALFLVPIYWMAALVLRSCGRASGRVLPWLALLTLPFLVPSFLSAVVNMEVEEGFSYAFLAVAFTLIALASMRGVRTLAGRSVVYDMSVAAALGLLYLAKSSMILVVVVLLLFYVVQTGVVWRKVLVVALVACAPLGWAMRQHRMSGRYTLGTSWDGSNLYKGNNAAFLYYYPPPPFGNLDWYEPDLAPPRPLGTEWAYNDWSERAAIQYMRSHPYATVMGWEKKVYVLFLSLHTYGNSPQGLPPAATLAGMVLLRALLWSALVLSGFAAVRRSGQTRGQGLMFLATVAAVAAPYIVGFGFTRHISVLIYPSAIVICLLACQLVWGVEAGTSDATSAQKP